MKTQKGQAITVDLFSAMDHVEEQKRVLWSAWMEKSQDFECVLRLAIQDVEALKNTNPELNVSVAYQLGRLDGYTELFEELYRLEAKTRGAEKTIGEPSPKVRQILLSLYRNDGMRHGELAVAVGSPYNSLTNIMKKVLLSGAVESVRSGRNTCYHLTEAGRQYCERRLCGEDKLKDMIETAVQKSFQKIFAELSAAKPRRREGDELPEQWLRPGDRFIPKINNETCEPLLITSISDMAGAKAAEMVSIENSEEPAAVSQLAVRGCV